MGIKWVIDARNISSSWDLQFLSSWSTPICFSLYVSCFIWKFPFFWVSSGLVSCLHVLISSLCIYLHVFPLFPSCQNIVLVPVSSSSVFAVFLLLHLCLYFSTVFPWVLDFCSLPPGFVCVVGPLSQVFHSRLHQHSISPVPLCFY